MIFQFAFCMFTQRVIIDPKLFPGNGGRSQRIQRIQWSQRIPGCEVARGWANAVGLNWGGWGSLGDLVADHLGFWLMLVDVGWCWLIASNSIILTCWYDSKNDLASSQVRLANCEQKPSWETDHRRSNLGDMFSASALDDPKIPSRNFIYMENQWKSLF